MEIFRIVGDNEQDIFWRGWLHGSNNVFSCVAVQRCAVPSSTCLLTVDTNVQTAPTSTPAVSSSVPPGSAWRARKPQPASTTKRGAPQSPHVSVSLVSTAWWRLHSIRLAETPVTGNFLASGVRGTLDYWRSITGYNMAACEQSSLLQSTYTHINPYCDYDHYSLWKIINVFHIFAVSEHENNGLREKSWHLWGSHKWLNSLETLVIIDNNGIFRVYTVF